MSRRPLALAAIREAIASGRFTTADVDALLNLYHAVMTGERE
jgi:hypothetical protein